MSKWNDFNDAEAQSSGIIPDGEVVVVKQAIKPGNYDDPEQGWDGGYATASNTSNSIYLACNYTVVEGDYKGRKIYSNIGLYSPKSSAWADMGRSFIRAALNSARGIMPDDTSPRAQSGRKIRGFADLDGLVFVARVGIEPDNKGGQRNTIKRAIEPDHEEYIPIKKAASPPPATRQAQPANRSRPPIPPPQADDDEFNDVVPF